MKQDMLIKKPVLFTLVIIVVGALIVYIESQKPERGSSVPSKVEKSIYPKAPDFVGIERWINSEPLHIQDLQGKVVLVDFWTYTCINCIRTLPHLVAWDKKYRDKGLIIIGVHTPEFNFEKKYENVVSAMQKYNITYIVAQDNDYATWRAYQNRYWPHKFLIDAQGYIRYHHIGEGAYEETEMKIQELLAEIGNTVSDETGTIEDKTPILRTTPELYAGALFALPRGQNIGNEQGLLADQIIDYVLPKTIQKDTIYLEGKWKSNPDNIQAQDAMQAAIVLDFTASSVNIVAGSLGEEIPVEVFINNQYIAKDQAGDDIIFKDNKALVLVKEPRLYNLVKGQYGNYVLKLEVQSKDLTINAFTFG